MPDSRAASWLPPLAIAHRPRSVLRSTTIMIAAITAKASTGTGMWATSLVARLLNWSGTPVTGEPPASTLARPRPTYSVPSVAITGLNLMARIRNALTDPTKPPASTPPTNASSSGQLTCATSVAAVTPATATIEPTDRSRPPATMTGVTAQATIPTNDTWRIRLVRFSVAMNWLVASENQMPSATRMTMFMTRVLLVGLVNQGWSDDRDRIRGAMSR